MFNIPLRNNEKRINIIVWCVIYRHHSHQSQVTKILTTKADL